MLHISDLSKLRITKVKDWAVNFKYGGKYYLLHDTSEEEYYAINLYEKVFTSTGSCSLVLLKSKCDSSSVGYSYTDYPRTKVFSHLDKE